MQRLIVARLFQAVFVLIGASMIVFFLLHRASGDIALSLLPDWATEAQVELYRHQLGLDQPIHLQYWNWITGVVQGDFGASFRSGQPAMTLILERFPATVQLTVAAMAIAIVVSFPLGIVAAIYRGSWWDRIAMTFAVIGQAMPNFWLGLMLMLLFAVQLGWLPVSGRESPQSIILPAVALATSPLAQLTRLVRSGMLEILSQDYIRTARAKGLKERWVIYRHALRNALLPIVTVIGLEIGTLLNGSVVTEAVFAWPGVGRLLIESLYERDIPVVEAGVLFVAALYITINLVVDITYGLIDPRVRYD